MGLVSQTFQLEDATRALEEIRALAAARLDRDVSLVWEPPGTHYTIDSLNVVVLEVGEELHLLLRGLARLTGGWGSRAGTVRRALRALGGKPTRDGRFIRFRFEGAPPTVSAVAARLGGVSTSRFPAHAVLKSPRSTAVEVQLHFPGPECLTFEAPIAVFGPLYELVLELAREVGGAPVGPGRDGEYATLHEAAYFGSVPSVRAFLDAGADPNGILVPHGKKWWSSAAEHPSPLHMALGLPSMGRRVATDLCRAPTVLFRGGVRFQSAHAGTARRSTTGGQRGCEDAGHGSLASPGRCQLQ
jgi:hypothetical protein